MRIVDCTEEEHAGAILDIMNEAIENSTALYDYVRRPHESMVRWFDTKRAGDFPVLGAVDDAGTLLGFASYGTFRPWPAYKYSVEHSVYVEKGHRGRGVGRALLRELIARAERHDIHVLIGGIDRDNHASIELHEKLGFKHAGTIHHAGFKFGRWLDLVFYELLLETPRAPVDG